MSLEEFIKKQPKLADENKVIIIQQINRIIEKLHQNEYVLGNIRSTNLLITSDFQIKLIDFDWANVYGKAKYPYFLNEKLDWPKGVSGGKLHSC